MNRAVGLVVVAGLVLVPPQPAAPIAGLTAAEDVARTYDAILDADADAIRDRLARTCGPASAEVCRTLETVGVWWAIALEPESRARDAAFLRMAESTIAATAQWTSREPMRAEAWFYHGAAYGARVQWKAQRAQRLGAARDGKAGNAALERALALDPELHDAQFGLGMYRYYAATAPALFRMFRWLLLLPGGDRADGLRRIQEARERGLVVRGEADYQLHRIYLWYEHRPADALAIVQRLQRRYPHNPLFHQIEAEIHDEQFHDAAASLAASTRLLALAQDGAVHEPALASVRARLNMARQLPRLGQTARAAALLEALLAEQPTRPPDAIATARRLLDAIGR